MTSEVPGSVVVSDWDDLSGWWLDELASDSAYEKEVTPLLLSIGRPHGRTLDLGCGEGRVMRSLAAIGCTPVGMDSSARLLASAALAGPVFEARLPSLACVRSDSFDSAVMSLVLEHVAEHREFLSEVARVVRKGGSFGLVMNHPVYTAPESAPIEEPDGEVLWRPGRYFDRGHTDEPAERGHVRFHHRPLGVLLSDAAECGWHLAEMSESGVTESQVRRHPPLGNQRHIPRLLALRWIRL